MAVVNESLVSRLVELIRICKDAEARFYDASRQETHEGVKELLLQYATQRSQFISELRQEINRLGGSLGEIHSAVTEAEYDDNTAIQKYEELLDDDIPTDLKEILEKQSIQIEEAREHLAELRQTQMATEQESGSDTIDYASEREKKSLF